ncbi:hypothetical protein MCAG_00008 [Micromonospora sp. ATCC 39149]|uniref:hypothetical protein n=1 Tax=Micromonospora sp. (strain ATCC 39149 / NRRL 15099 / SCC 1413) TaxID=219305 RepID=UPI0001A51226|nr:hypothetical protein [Micromonospora sp. ATCC 39149]EEP69681.1 hypothetical protein MCAG_00008 [Micromonospora sp. ATCC 39149]
MPRFPAGVGGGEVQPEPFEDGRRPGEVVVAAPRAPVGVEQATVVAGPRLQQRVALALGDLDRERVVAHRLVVPAAVVQHHAPLHPGPPGVGTGELRQRGGHGPQGRSGAAGVGQHVAEAHPGQRPRPGRAGGPFRPAQVTQRPGQVVEFPQGQADRPFGGGPLVTGDGVTVGEHPLRDRDRLVGIALHGVERGLGRAGGTGAVGHARQRSR